MLRGVIILSAVLAFPFSASAGQLIIELDEHSRFLRCIDVELGSMQLASCEVIVPGATTDFLSVYNCIALNAEGEPIAQSRFKYNGGVAEFIDLPADQVSDVQCLPV